MDRTAPFLLRRVFVGVLVGLLLSVLAFFGWTRWRTAQFHERQDAVLTGYRHLYENCVAGGTAPAYCGQRLMATCTADAFWRVEPPFVIDFASRFDDAATRCRETTTG
jgi:hypothetical protein